MRSFRSYALPLVVCWLGHIGVSAQTVLRSTAEHPARQYAAPARAVPVSEIKAAVTLQLIQAEQTATGDLYLTVSAHPPAPESSRLILRIPLASTGDAYGESRTCTLRPDGSAELTFTAGLDERNFVAFGPAAEKKDIQLLLNRYLCRALAAPFQCADKPVRLSADAASWSGWTLAEKSAVVLESAAPAAVELSPIQFTDTGKPFDPLSCPVIAPSDGVCCVQGKTTNWHCGGKPSGPGWHQVSGDCFHHETGGTCHD